MRDGAVHAGGQPDGGVPELPSADAVRERLDALRARIDALRHAGHAQEAEGVAGSRAMPGAQLAQLEALARRVAAPGLPATVQGLLLARLEAGVDSLPPPAAIGDVPARARAPAPRAARPAPAARCEPLAQLNASMQRAARPKGELASADRFRRTWSGTRAQERVLQAVSRRPANAGPLNSHGLVAEALALMHTLSGDYLRRFVAQVEALAWLEAAGFQEAPRAKREKADKGEKGAKSGTAKRAKR